MASITRKKEESVEQIASGLGNAIIALTKLNELSEKYALKLDARIIHQITNKAKKETTEKNVEKSVERQVELLRKMISVPRRENALEKPAIHEPKIKVLEFGHGIKGKDKEFTAKIPVEKGEKSLDVEVKVWDKWLKERRSVIDARNEIIKKFRENGMSVEVEGRTEIVAMLTKNK